MNKFKRLFALLLALAMVFALVACGEKDEEDEKKSKEEKFLSEVEDLMDEIIEAIEDGDQDKADELYKELDDLEDEYDEILEELEEDDEDKAEEFAEDFEKLFDKFEERQEEAISSNDGDKKPSNKDNEDEKNTDTEKDEEVKPIAPPAVEKVEADITGTWVYEVNMSDAFGSGINQGAGMEIAPNTAFNMEIVLVFDDNGEYELAMQLDEDSAQEYYDDLIDNAVQLYISVLEDSGASLADFESQMGMTMEEYARSAMDASWEVALSQFNNTTTGYYMVDGDYIYTAYYESDLGDGENYMEFDLSGRTLTITKSVEDGEDQAAMAESLGLEFPWTFKKN